jgi:hypothetical protein
MISRKRLRTKYKKGGTMGTYITISTETRTIEEKGSLYDIVRDLLDVQLKKMTMKEFFERRDILNEGYSLSKDAQEQNYYDCGNYYIKFYHNQVVVVDSRGRRTLFNAEDTIKFLNFGILADYSLEKTREEREELLEMYKKEIEKKWFKTY